MLAPCCTLTTGANRSWTPKYCISPINAWSVPPMVIIHAVTVLAWMITIGGTLQALIGLIQYFGVHDLLAPVVKVQQGASIYGNINQRNHFSMQIALAGFALVYLHAAGRAAHALAIALWVLFAFILTASGSRTAAG